MQKQKVNQNIENNAEQGNKQIKQKARSKRRDLFETAPISRNYFETSNNDQEYINQKKRNIQKIAKSNSVPLPQKQQKNTGQNKSTEVHQVIYQSHGEKPIYKQNNQGFIFQASSDSDEQKKQNQVKLANSQIKVVQNKNQNQNQQINYALNNNYDINFNDEDEQNSDKAEKSSNKIIFQEDNRSDSQGEQEKNNNKKLKNVICLFGEKIQVDVQFQQNQQNQKGQSKKQNVNTPQNQQQKKPKQLLRAYTIMPANTFAKMRLTRNKKNQGGIIYSLYLQANLRFIMSARQSSSQTYLLSEHYQKIQQNDVNYLGKVKTSFFGNQLNLFSKGLNLQKAKSNNVYPRELICTVVTHSQQLMEEVKPRDFTVYILKQQYSYYKDLQGVKLYQQEITLDKLYNQYETNKNKIYVFENRKSKWNQKQKMHSLNMKGRAKLPSIKNFILQSPQENGREIMLFGKMDENQFSFDIHYPLSPILGMAIALTSFSHKSW